MIPWSPLARGWLTGSRSGNGARRTTRASNDDFANHLYNEADFDVIESVITLAAERGLPPAQIALAWLLHKPAVSAPVIGATKVTHLDDAVAALDVTLTETELNRLEESYRPHTVKEFG